MGVYVCGGGTAVLSTSTTLPLNNFRELVLSFHRLGPGISRDQQGSAEAR